MVYEYEHRISGEPTEHNAPADFDRQYELIRQKLRDEHERCDKIEGKVATLIAGTIAVIGFSLDHIATWWQAIAVLAFAFPLVEFYNAYKTITWDDAPSSLDLLKHPWFPQTTVASAAVAMANCIQANGPKVDEKAQAMNRGFRYALVATALITILRIISIAIGATPNEQHAERAAASASPTSSASGSSHSGNANNVNRQGQHGKVAPAKKSPRRHTAEQASPGDNASLRYNDETKHGCGQ